MGSFVRRGTPPFDDAAESSDDQQPLGEFLSREDGPESLGEFLSGRFATLDVDAVEEVRSVRRRERE